MSEHITALLEAYHDGELQGVRLRGVEAHLEKCESCRAELRQLDTLRELLQASPAAESLMSPERFEYLVTLRLPRREEQPLGRKLLGIAWRLVPVGLLTSWVFFQAVATVSGVVAWGMRLGLALQFPWDLAVTPARGSQLLSMLARTDTAVGRATDTTVNFLSGGVLQWSNLLMLMVPVVIGLLYWSWLASWCMRHRCFVSEGV